MKLKKKGTGFSMVIKIILAVLIAAAFVLAYAKIINKGKESSDALTNNIENTDVGEAFNIK